MPWCPHCLHNGDTTVETHRHLLEQCPSLHASRYKLARTINNIFRDSAAPTALINPIPLTEEEDHPQQVGIEGNTTPGWETHTTDKHGRQTLICTGPEGRNINEKNLLTTWLHSTMTYCINHLPWENHKTYIEALNPEPSIDPYLLQGIATAIKADCIYDVIPHNPFIPTQTRSNYELPTGTQPVLFKTVHTNQDWTALAAALPSNRSWVLLATKEEEADISGAITFGSKQVIAAHQIKQWGRSFWSGTGGLFPDTCEHEIHVYTAENITPHQLASIKDTLYMRSASGGSITPTSDIQTSHLIQETPNKLATLLTTNVSSPAKTQLLSGGITIEVIEEWKATLPRRIHQKIYRSVHLAIITHQHDIWLKRNKAAHPKQEIPQVPPN
jgi:hypothetical protein